MRCHFTPTGVAVITKTITSVRKAVGKLEPSYISGWYIKWCSCFGKKMVDSQKFKRSLVWYLRCLEDINPSSSWQEKSRTNWKFTFLKLPDNWGHKANCCPQNGDTNRQVQRITVYQKRNPGTEATAGARTGIGKLKLRLNNCWRLIVDKLVS